MEKHNDQQRLKMEYFHRNEKKRMKLEKQTIPKNIFQSWYTHKIMPYIKNSFDKQYKIGYRHIIYTDNEMDLFVNKHFPGKISDCYNKLNIITSKVDLWRYLVLYKYGGIYLDMDSLINVPLDQIILPDDSAIISREFIGTSPKLSKYFAQCVLIFSKRHPILKQTIDFVINNIENNHVIDIHKLTGPSVFTDAVVHFHNNLFRKRLRIKQIRYKSNISFSKNYISYRFCGVQFNGAFTYKHNKTKDLRKKKKYDGRNHWRKDQKINKLLN